MRSRSRRPTALLAFRLLPQVLESLAVLRAKISEQRGAEARNVTSQMQTNLEASGKRVAPKIEQTLELLRSGSTTLRSRRQPEHEPVTVLK
jgi:hypothetical protein